MRIAKRWEVSANFFLAFAHYGWAKLLHSGLGGHETLNLYSEAIARMPKNDGIPLLFRNIFKNAYLPYKDPETLKSFLKVIDEFTYDNSERLGDAFEFLLSIMESQGDAGQLSPYIGELDMTDIYRGEDPDTVQPTALERYVRDRIASSVSRATINYALKTFNKIGRLANEEWRRRVVSPSSNHSLVPISLRRRKKVDW
jgi:hypothetical protein